MVEQKEKIIDEQIKELELERDNVKGRPCEVYARIVGYYRAIRNWNIGKKSEWKQRISYSEDSFNKDYPNLPVEDVKKKVIGGLTIIDIPIVSFLFIYRTTCPKCPPFKKIMETLKIEGKSFNADEPEGFDKAVEYGVFTAPTALFLDADGTVVRKTSKIPDLLNWKKCKEI